MPDDSASAPPNPYQPPTASLDDVPQLDPSALTRNEVVAFAGTNGDYYWSRWSRVKRDGFFAGFNWAAGFFNLLWLLYRRMYREFFFGMGLAVLSGVVEALISTYLLDGELERELNRAGNFVFIAVAGSLGNGLYLRRARAAVARVRQQIPDAGPGRETYLATFGGTRWLGVIVAAVLFIALGIAVVSAGD